MALIPHRVYNAYNPAYGQEKYHLPALWMMSCISELGSGVPSLEAEGLLVNPEATYIIPGKGRKYLKCGIFRLMAGELLNRFPFRRLNQWKTFP
jgi:hypothetical protein